MHQKRSFFRLPLQGDLSRYNEKSFYEEIADDISLLRTMNYCPITETLNAPIILFIHLGLQIKNNSDKEATSESDTVSLHDGKHRILIRDDELLWFNTQFKAINL